ncbi:hypothetical protein HID58_037763 [Brassica napus]|uniref:Uncharacterized protein n=1 Tax=Brassica napus TaxID=3708 RepID=A0ABQ8BM67_BRANA|nr:hypothetical protein HID58_037763 [Brassica napus]
MVDNWIKEIQKTQATELDQKRIELQIWDTTRQERFQTIPDFPSRFSLMLYMHSFSFLTMYRGAMGISLACDVTDESSFNNKHSLYFLTYSLIGRLMQLSKARKLKLIKFPTFQWISSYINNAHFLGRWSEI